MKLRFFVLTPALLAAACSVPIVPQPASTAAQNPVTPPPPAVTNTQGPVGPWTDWPITPGDWVYRSDDRGSLALFGPAGRDAIVTLRCDRNQRKIYFSRADDAGTRGGNMTIRASSALKQFSAQSAGGAPAYVAVEMTPSDAFLDAMIFTRGRIAVEAAGQQSIAIPVWAEIAKVVEDCRG